jgi:hypothetical protein
MALTTVSEMREKLYEETEVSVSILVDPTVSESVLLEALGDRYTRMILLSIIDEPKSVIDISRERNIPISSAYRKIHWLERMRLITAKGFVITDDGKKYHLYQSRIRSVHVSLATNTIRVNFTGKNGQTYNPSREEEIPIY